MTTEHHLEPETLARLVDERPSANEAEHLQACPVCADELAGLQEQTQMLARLPALDWHAIEDRLADAGLLDAAHPAPAGERMQPMIRHRNSTSWMRAAAAVLLFLGGVGLGSSLATRASAPNTAADPATLETELLATNEVTLEEAEDFVRQTQEMQLAALFLYRDVVEREGGTAMGDPLLRVALYDHVLAAAEAAIREAPADPFLNGLFVNTVAERQMALDEIAFAAAIR